jgi:two-component system osmolarity sensor histidine kinase EnvZ
MLTVQSVRFRFSAAAGTARYTCSTLFLSKYIKHMSLLAHRRLAWLKSGLLWRTFILLAVLITFSMMAWVTSFRVLERTPRAKQIAAQVVSMVTLTRAALTHSAPESRRALLFDLASDEGIRIYPLEPTDQIEPVADSALFQLIEENITAKLGSDTQYAGKVNGIPGFWVSFRIGDEADDDYWMMVDRGRIERRSSTQFLRWGVITLIVALFGAVFISRLINLPLARLTAAARRIAKGHSIEPLPEKGPTEIKEANRSFNQMVSDLERVESDRAIILAGISHDLRTPISRMLLEVEMASLSDDARQGMQSDLAQMDAIIGQFLDYAKPTDPANFKQIDLSGLLTDAIQDASRIQDVKVTSRIDPDIHVHGNVTDLKRVFSNLIENARRYGRTADSDLVDLEIAVHAEDGMAIVDIADHGPGIPESEMERLLRPFARLNTARSQANGAGLGLAIVDRMVERHNGHLQLINRKQGGLLVKIALPIC